MKPTSFNLCCLVLAATIVSCLGKLEEKFAWKEVSYDWPSPEAYESALKSGQYIRENNLPLGIERWRNKLFITVPRWKSGVASSLNYIELPTEEKSPVLKPYPSWSENTLVLKSDGEHKQSAAGRANAEKPAASSEIILKSNSSIISTFRVRADECDRLWVLDTGLANILDNPQKVVPDAIVIYDLKTDSLITRYEIPKDQTKEDTFFANVVVDTDKDDCSDAFAYVPDLGGYGLVVYSLKENRSWRIKHNFFHFDPLMGDFNVGGVRFQWTDGIFALAVGNKKPDQSKDVYFHALASTKEFVVSNRVLKNETYANSPKAYNDYMLVGDRGHSGQSTAEVFDEKTNVIFYTQINKDAIGCWNTQKPLNPDTQGLVDSDSTALVFPNDIKLDQERNLWVLSDKMPLYIYKSLDPNEINYRVMTGHADDLIKGTPCEV